MTTFSTTSTRRSDTSAALDQLREQTPDPGVGALPGLERASASIDGLRGLGDRVRQLEQAVQILDAAADAGDVDLARTCRTVLDSLRSRQAVAAALADTSGGGEQARPPRPLRAPLPPPGWARVSVPEDGGVIHEAISSIHPTARIGGANGWEPMPTDVSLSVTDLLIDGRWVRTQPTLQVEGGSYYLDGARQLRDAIHQFLVTADDPEPDAVIP